MLAITRGPSRKPVCAATKSSAASATSSVTITNAVADRERRRSSSRRRARRSSTAFIVLPSSGGACDEQVAEQDAAGGDGERGRHQEHRPLAGLHARLAHASRRRSRRPRCRCRCRRPSSRRSRTKASGQQPDASPRLAWKSRCARRRERPRADPPRWLPIGTEDRERVGDEEDDEDRREDRAPTPSRRAGSAPMSTIEDRRLRRGSL